MVEMGAQDNEGKRARGSTWKLVLAYDGTEFHGWQVQPEEPTVQGELRAAIARITGEEVLPQGSGRTDAGVHALGQVASFALAAPIPEPNLARALNRTLPASIRVLTAQHAPEAFTPGTAPEGRPTSTVSFTGRLALRFWRDTSMRSIIRSISRRCSARPYECSASMTLLRLRPGTSDRKRARQVREAHRPYQVRGGAAGIAPRVPSGRASATLGDANSRKEGEPELCSPTGWSGNGFLHHMVRNLVGTFLEIGHENLGEEDIFRILAERARASAGPTAPARGLCLVEVEY